MFRYVSFIWNSADPAAASAAERFARRLVAMSPSWHLAVGCPGLKAYYTDARTGANRAYVLRGERGVVLGKLYHRSDGSELPISVEEISASEGGSIVSTNGKHLIDRYWGRYVAFLKDPVTGARLVLRGPMGTLPCFGIIHQRVRVYFSWAEDVLALGVPSMSVSWDYVAAHLPAVALECRETALHEVSQVLAGEIVEIAGDEVSAALQWRPDRIVHDIVEERDVAATLLRQTARQCIRAWACAYEKIVVRLSGGLDSSIVVNSLRQETRTTSTVCLNYFSSGSDSDERNYARAAAAAANCELVERRRDPGVRLEEMLCIARTPKPSVYLGNLDTGRSDAEIAHLYGASAIFTGAGGDTLFYQVPSELPAADFIFHRGLRSGLVGAALDAARLGGVSVWAALNTALQQGLLRRPLRPQFEDQQFALVERSVIEAAQRNTRFCHPLLIDAVKQPPGKRWQLRSLCLPMEYHDPLGREGDPEQVHPLLSQPLTELCMRIPSYLLIQGGRDRALARRAFAGDLPPMIARRRSKGGMEEHIKAIFVANRNFVRGVLLDGELANRGLLNRRKLEEVLSGRPTAIENPLVDLYTYLSIEVWLQRWSGHRQRVAA